MGLCLPCWPRPSLTRTAIHAANRNGGAGSRVLDVGAAVSSQQGLVDWMLKAGPGSKGSGAAATTGSPSSRRATGEQRRSTGDGAVRDAGTSKRR